MYKMILMAAFISGLSAAHAQGPLERNISVEFKQQRLDNVLEILSNKANFYFSYNSAILKKDSLVTLTVQDKCIRQILDLLFHGNFEYKVSGNYIILRRLPVKTTMLTGPPATEERRYSVSGFILDEETGEKISQASVYDKQGLVATLSDEEGFFTVRVRNRHGPPSITVSKEFYDDTAISLSPGPGQRLTVYISPSESSRTMITVSPGDYLLPDSIRIAPDPGSTRIAYAKKDLIQVELTPLGKFLLSSRLRIQSVNLRKFFAERSFQISLIPSLGTNGFLSPQVVNQVSLNILGGYSGGVNGAEMGSLFNIDKKNVRYFQAAGLFNVVGGSVRGLQMAGFHNTVLDSLKGWQLGGFSNFTKRKLTGLQAAGFYNHLGDSLRGVQLAGFANFSGKNTNGVQVAGLVNVTGGETHGAQISGLINYTRHLKGVQIGVINIADTSEGYSIGLINMVRKGYHEFSLFANEISPFNFAFRSGNRKLYSILLLGINPQNTNRYYSYGFGLGRQFPLTRNFCLAPELSLEHVLPGSLDNKHFSYLTKLHLDLHWRLTRHLSFSAGPSLAIYSADRTYLVNGQVFKIPESNYPSFRISDNVKGWIGWQAAINFF